VGSFITNLHARGAEPERVVEAVRALNWIPAFVSGRASEAWTSIYAEAGDQNEEMLAAMTSDLSRTLGRSVIAFLVHDSDIFEYFLAENGHLVDVYNSDPGYFTDEPQPPAGGDAKVLGHVCVEPTRTDELDRLLRTKSSQAGDQGGRKASSKDTNVLISRLKETYPAMAAANPNLPSLEALLAQVQVLPAGRLGSFGSAGGDGTFVFAEDMVRELAGHLGLDPEQALGSYRYIVNGEKPDVPLLTA
jgi:hypothetical protein